MEYITSHVEDVFTPTLIERFDLVGMDPRGIANSSPVRCTVPVITPETTLFPKTEQQFQQLVKHNREVGLNCLDRAGELVRHMDTVSVARDHEALRLALGENKINWLGISYGTQLAAIGWPADASIAAADRARVRTQVAREFFLTEHGREPVNARELAGVDREELEAALSDGCKL